MHAFPAHDCSLARGETAATALPGTWDHDEIIKKWHLWLVVLHQLVNAISSRTMLYATPMQANQQTYRCKIRQLRSCCV